MILKEAAAKPGNKAQLNPAIDLNWLQTRPLTASPVKKKIKVLVYNFSSQFRRCILTSSQS